MPLVVRPDRAKVRSWLSLILVLNGVLAMACLALGLWAVSVTDSSTATLAGAPFAITLAGCVFQMVFHAYHYGRMAGTDVVAEVGPEGIRARTAKGEPVALPWAAVASARRSWNTVIVTPQPGAGPKLVVPTRAVDTDSATILAAVHHFSGGRA